VNPVRPKTVSQRAQLHRAARAKRRLWWRSFDGRAMRIADMTDSHLVNSVNMLLREEPNNVRVPTLLTEVRRRGLKLTMGYKPSRRYQ